MSNEYFIQNIFKTQIRTQAHIQKKHKICP